MGYCKSPLKGFIIGFGSNGRSRLKVTSKEVDHLEMINNQWTKIYDKDLPLRGSQSVRPYITKYIDIPCGQCVGCRLQRSREWANRMMMELETTEGRSSFVTLTYDDEHLPLSEGVNPVTGEIEEFGTLVLEDLQKFIKRLRKANPEKKIRYFACGEYGENTNRPHFHLILFGYFPKDAKFIRRGRKGNYNYYVSEELEKLWPFGLHVIADVTWESCAYTARYVTKKLTGNAGEVYETMNIKPPFVIMSNRPGIGYDYFMIHREDFSDDVKMYYLSTNEGSISFSKPRYFKKIDDTSVFLPEDAKTLLYMASQKNQDLQEIMSDQEEERRVIAFSTDVSYYEELAAEGLYMEQKTKILKRGMI